MNKILLFGEPLIRLTPINYQSLSNGESAKIYYGGSEINIAKNLQGFQVNTKIITGLPDTPVGDSFIDFLNQCSIDTSSIQRVGERIGLYYMEDGFGCRQSQVYYDRKHTSINNMNIESMNMDNIFKNITHFHFSGITIAISSHIRKVLLILLQEAKKRNITISIDLNLRTKMISVDDAKIQFSKYAMYADYCFGIDPIMSDENDTAMFDRYHSTSKTIQARMQKLKDKYKFKAIFHTLRTSDENGHNIYKCYGLDTNFVESVELKTQVLQRVGSGDAFVAGALYKMINNASLQETVNFAVASGTYKCTIDGDSMFIDTSQIEKLLENNKDIIR